MATPEQLASIVARQEREIREAEGIVSDCVDYQTCSLEQKLTYLKLDTLAATLEVLLDGTDLDRPGNQHYLGATPPEMEGLVEETLIAARAVQSAQKSVPPNCSQTVRSENCEQVSFEFRNAAEKLIDALNAWVPYT